MFINLLLKIVFFVFLASTAFAKLPTDLDFDLAPNVPTVEVGGKRLILNGTGVHRRLFFRIYRVYLFLESPSRDSQYILHSEGIKFARMFFLRDVSAKQIKEAWRNDFETECAKKCEGLRHYLDEVTSKLTAMREGEVLEFTFYPNELQIEKPGFGKMSIPSSEFATHQLSIWLGKHPPSQSFKKGLLGIH